MNCVYGGEGDSEITGSPKIAGVQRGFQEGEEGFCTMQ